MQAEATNINLAVQVLPSDPTRGHYSAILAQVMARKYIVNQMQSANLCSDKLDAKFVSLLQDHQTRFLRS